MINPITFQVTSTSVLLAREGAKKVVWKPSHSSLINLVSVNQGSGQVGLIFCYSSYAGRVWRSG